MTGPTNCQPCFRFVQVHPALGLVVYVLRQVLSADFTDWMLLNVVMPQL
jgi:hypothetical protein